MGLILNQRASHISFPDLLERLGIETADGEDGVADDVTNMSIHVGGPVETGRGFVLHSADYFADEFDTADRGRRLSHGNHRHPQGHRGGQRSQPRDPRARLRRLVAGSAGSEIQANGWLNCPADPELIFDPNLEAKYTRALAKIGIDPSHLVSDAGHA